MNRIREYLKNYKMLKAEIKAIEIDINELYDEIGPAAICYEERPAPTNKFSSSTENMTYELIEKVESLKKEKKSKEREVQRIENALSVLNETEKKIIEQKYITNKEWRSICFDLGITERQGKRLADESVQRIGKILRMVENE